MAHHDAPGGWPTRALGLGENDVQHLFQDYFLKQAHRNRIKVSLSASRRRSLPYNSVFWRANAVVAKGVCAEVLQTATAPNR